jgi:hypothetical protein
MFRRLFGRRRFPTFLGSAYVLAPAMGAQTHWDAALYAGVYWPTHYLASEGGVTLQQRKSVTLGTRVTVRWPTRLGIEGTVGYASSSLSSSLEGVSFPAHVLTVSAKGLFRVTPADAHARFQVGGGVGLIDHGSDVAYPPWYAGPRTFFAGVLNAGAVIGLDRWLALRLDMEDYVYSAHLGQCTRYRGGDDGVCDVYFPSANRLTSTSPKLQIDFVLSLGIAVALNRTQYARD